MLAAFDAHLTQRVVFGDGAVSQLGSLVKEMGARRILLVSDMGIVQAGILHRAQDSLDKSKIEHADFKETEPNPEACQVERAAQFARDAGPFDLIAAVGGGSVMDCAKGVNFLLANGGTMRDYWGFGKANKPMLPSIGVPTTAGTGSEAQSYAIISDDKTKRKMACGDPKARFHAVILDPSLAASAPRGVSAAAGIDAVSHALESYVCLRRNPLSQMYSREAWRLMEKNLETALADPSNIQARAGTLLGAYYAGMGIELSMLGAAHAMANPLTARYRIAHGEAVALTLPPVIRHNRQTAGDLYDELAQTAGIACPVEERFLELRAAAQLTERLRDRGIPSADLPDLAARAAEEWTANFNPHPVDSTSLRCLYEQAY